MRRPLVYAGIVALDLVYAIQSTGWLAVALLVMAYVMLAVLALEVERYHEEGDD